MIEEKVAPLVHEGTSFGVYFLGVDTTYIMSVIYLPPKRGREKITKVVPRVRLRPGPILTTEKPRG